MDVKGEVHL